MQENKPDHTLPHTLQPSPKLVEIQGFWITTLHDQWNHPEESRTKKRSKGSKDLHAKFELHHLKVTLLHCSILIVKHHDKHSCCGCRYWSNIHYIPIYLERGILCPWPPLLRNLSPGCHQKLVKLAGALLKNSQHPHIWITGFTAIYWILPTWPIRNLVINASCCKGS